MKLASGFVLVCAATLGVSAAQSRQTPPPAAPAPRPAAPVAGPAGSTPPAATARSAKELSPIDLTGYWVAVITEDWRWRMLTPPKGDYASVPLNDEGRRVADQWNLEKDDAAGLSCKPYGVGNIMRMPGRMHISWADDNTLKVEFDAGTQTRLLHFGAKPARAGEKTWQGYSAAEWHYAAGSAPGRSLDRNGVPVAGGGGVGGPAAASPGNSGAVASTRGGALSVTTTDFRDGYLRKNGVPYSANANISEWFDRVGPEPNGDVILLVRTVVEDPKYLQIPFITSTHFKLEKDGAKWKPSPCKIDPPVEPGK
jgi:hypothetical protein